MIQVREYEEKDFHDVFRWWRAHTDMVLDPVLLSKHGYIAVNDSKPLAAAWLYYGDNQAFAMIGFTVANPNVGPKTKVAAVREVVMFCEEIARGLGFKHVLVNSDQPGLTKLLGRMGYLVTNPHASLTKKIGDERGLLAEEIL